MIRFSLILLTSIVFSSPTLGATGDDCIMKRALAVQIKTLIEQGFSVEEVPQIIPGDEMHKLDVAMLAQVGVLFIGSPTEYGAYTEGFCAGLKAAAEYTASQ